MPLLLFFFQHTYANGERRISGRLGEPIRNRFDLFAGRFNGKLEQKICINMQFKNSPRRFYTPVISQKFTGNSIFEVRKNPHFKRMGIFQKIHCSDLTDFCLFPFQSFQRSQENFIPPWHSKITVKIPFSTRSKSRNQEFPLFLRNSL